MLMINADNFEEEVLKSERPVLLDFSANWCGPCHMVTPTLEEIENERPDIKVAKVDVDQSPDLAQRFGITAIPALFAVKDGETKGSLMGVQSKIALLSMMDA